MTLVVRGREAGNEYVCRKGFRKDFAKIRPNLEIFYSDFVYFANYLYTFFKSLLRATTEWIGT